MKTSNDENQAVGVPKYTQGTFDKQLNYNLWSTSRTRYIAARRLTSKDRRSSKAIAFLSAYLIIFTLFDYLFLTEIEGYSGNYILLANITFSLLILVFSQLESSASYGVRALRFHSCGQEVGSLYKQLRRLKSRYEGHDKDENFYKEIQVIDEKYDETIKNHENHELLDFEIFKTTYPDYEDHLLKWYQIAIIKIQRYFKDIFVYQLVTYLPMTILVLVVFMLDGLV